MPIKLESLTAVAAVNVDQLAVELLSEDANNTAELGTDGRILVKLPEEQNFTVDLLLLYRLAS
jgi:hypothetical protein